MYYENGEGAETIFITWIWRVTELQRYNCFKKYYLKMKILFIITIMSFQIWAAQIETVNARALRTGNELSFNSN